MRYAQIRSIDISNGTGVGVSLFIQGCSRHCKGCHNPEQWSFDGGKLFTRDTQNQIISLLKRPYVSRFSILGGEPLEPRNYFHLACLCYRIKRDFPHIQIWVYTGDTWENIQKEIIKSVYLSKIIDNIDILVDGEFIQEQKDINLEFKGSENQRIIDVQESLRQKEIVLWM